MSRQSALHSRRHPVVSGEFRLVGEASPRSLDVVTSWLQTLTKASAAPPHGRCPDPWRERGDIPLKPGNSVTSEALVTSPLLSLPAPGGTLELNLKQIEVVVRGGRVHASLDESISELVMVGQVPSRRSRGKQP